MLKTMWTQREAIAKERMAICNSCEHYNSFTTQCNQCGCFMIGKARMMGSECPIGKWKAAADEPTDS